MMMVVLLVGLLKWTKYKSRTTRVLAIRPIDTPEMFSRVTTVLLSPAKDYEK